MPTYIVKRLLILIATAFGVVTIAFILSKLRGSSAALSLGSRPTADQIADARETLGLNDSIPVQYFRYIGDVLQGDFGNSMVTGRPVIEDIAQRFPATLELVVPAMALSIAIGILIGTAAAVRNGQALDLTARVLAIAGAAVPAFFLAVALQLFFHGYLDILPLQGRIGSQVTINAPFVPVTGFYLVDTLIAGQWPAFLSSLQHLVLPVLTLTIAIVALIVRFTRNLMLDVLRSDHVRTAVAYGLPSRQIYFTYALRATLVPLVTVVGLTFGYLLGGSIVVEYVFDWPGLGSYVVNAVVVNDTQAALGVTILLSLVYLLINLAVDLAYHALDPRLKLQ
jgi:peptide/nickel transport system permease protein